MPAGEWSRISIIAREHHWREYQPQRWTMVLQRASNSVTLYFDSESGDLVRAFHRDTELRARTRRGLAAKVITILKGGQR